MNKRTIVLLLILAAVGGMAVYLFYFQNLGVVPPPEPEKVAKRIKIEVPEEKKEVEPAVQTQAPPAVPAKEEVIPAQAEVKPKEEVKPAVSEKKIVAKKEKPKTAVKKEFIYKPWVIHVASYAAKEDASAMINRLKKGKYNAYMTNFYLKKKHWYRVRVGFYATEKDAKAAAKKVSHNYHLNGLWTVKAAKKEVAAHLR